MSKDAASLPNDPALLKELVAQQVSTIESLTGKLAQLEHYIAQLVRARYGPRSEKLDPNQLALFDAALLDGALEEPAAERPPVSETPGKKRHVRRGARRQGLPGASVHAAGSKHDLSEAEKCLPRLRPDAAADRFGDQRATEVCSRRIESGLVSMCAWKYACRACQEHVAIAARQAGHRAGFAGGGAAVAQLVVGKFSDHLPLYRRPEDISRARPAWNCRVPRFAAGPGRRPNCSSRCTP